MSGQYLDWTMVDDDWTIYYGDRPKNYITILIIKRDTGRLDDVLSLLFFYIYYIFILVSPKIQKSSSYRPNAIQDFVITA